MLENQSTYDMAYGYHCADYHIVVMPRYLLYIFRSPLGANGVDTAHISAALRGSGMRSP